jgi:hypothetical protein
LRISVTVAAARARKRASLLGRGRAPAWRAVCSSEVAMTSASLRDSQTILCATARSLAKSGLLADLHELEARQEENRWCEADALATDLLHRWPDVAVVLVEVARLRARQGRRDEAMDLLYSEHVGHNVRLLNHKMCAHLVK